MKHSSWVCRSCQRACATPSRTERHSTRPPERSWRSGPLAPKRSRNQRQIPKKAQERQFNEEARRQTSLLVAREASPREAHQQRSNAQEILLPEMRTNNDLSRKDVMTKKGVFVTDKGLTTRRPADFHTQPLNCRGDIARHFPKETRWTNQELPIQISPPRR